MDFDAFSLSQEKQIGLFLGILIKLGIVTNSKALNESFKYCIYCAENYFDNPYHSFNHAIDVAYIVYYFLQDMRMASLLELKLSEMAILMISALGHDVLHPGTNNLFQVFINLT
jgi:hypothetical protein